LEETHTERALFSVIFGFINHNLPMNPKKRPEPSCVSVLGPVKGELSLDFFLLRTVPQGIRNERWKA
jgi:hypothetical protein